MRTSRKRKRKSLPLTPQIKRLKTKNKISKIRDYLSPLRKPQPLRRRRRRKPKRHSRGALRGRLVEGGSSRVKPRKRKRRMLRKRRLRKRRKKEAEEKEPGSSVFLKF